MSNDTVGSKGGVITGKKKVDQVKILREEFFKELRSYVDNWGVNFTNNQWKNIRKKAFEIWFQEKKVPDDVLWSKILTDSVFLDLGKEDQKKIYSISLFPKYILISVGDTEGRLRELLLDNLTPFLEKKVNGDKKGFCFLCDIIVPIPLKVFENLKPI